MLQFIRSYITTNNGLNSFNDQSVRFAKVFWHYTVSNCNNDTSACLLWPSPAVMAGVTAHKKSPLISQIVTVPILPEVLQKRNSTFMSPLLPPKGGGWGTVVSIDWCIYTFTILGDSRKYLYHTTGGILEFRGRGGVSWTGIPKTWGGNAVWNSKGMGGCFSSEFSEFPEERRRKLRLKSLTC